MITFVKELTHCGVVYFLESKHKTFRYLRTTFHTLRKTLKTNCGVSKGKMEASTPPRNGSATALRIVSITQ